ncbi:hypothetical protein MASR2M70_13260 [Bacillota bacterium]
MFGNFGISRVVGANDVLPVFAWKLDNSKIIYDNEMLLNVTNIHLEASNFKQICNEAMNDPDVIREKVFDLVESRGKLHNPYTNTGGLLAGTVERIGENYLNTGNIKVGDKVLVLCSATMIPLFIEEINSIDFSYGNFSVKGHGIIYGNCSVIKCISEIPINLLMMAFEESSSIYHIYQIAKGKNKFLIIGSDLLHLMLYGFAIRKAVGNDCHISVLLYNISDSALATGYKGIQMNSKVLKLFNNFDFVNASNTLQCADKLVKNHPSLFDLSINCSDAGGTEAINVIATKERGTVFFSSLINNYSIAIFLTEIMGKELSILCSDGYAENYENFMYEMLREFETDIGNLWGTAGENGTVEITGTKKPRRAKTKPITTEASEPGPIGYDFIYRSGAMNELAGQITKAAKYDSAVLIEGETGVGKDRVARLIHSLSARNMNPCIKVNCASIPSTLMESELFGYEPGAFTGAGAKGRQGFFELANKGILFLDEISELPMEMQAKLLRVIQDKEFYRIGGETPVKVDVRIISATNRNIKAMVEERTFRADLYYRLAVLVLHVPPLRKRKRDIIPLMEHYVNDFYKKNGIKKLISDEAIQYLLDYKWPGNIRELENLVQRIMINSDQAEIPLSTVIDELNSHRQWDMPEDKVPVEELAEEPETGEGKLHGSMMEHEKKIIEDALKCYGTTRKAASALGITQSAFMRKKKKYRL